jgi:hypothetical protein
MSTNQGFAEFPAPFVAEFNHFQDLSETQASTFELQQAFIDLVHSASAENVYSLMLASRSEEGRVWGRPSFSANMTTFKTSVPSGVLSDLYMTALSLSEEMPVFSKPGKHEKLVGHITNKSLDKVGRLLPDKRKYIEVEAERGSKEHSFAMLSL